MSQLAQCGCDGFSGSNRCISLNRQTTEENTDLPD
jgi:hypothetical protein